MSINKVIKNVNEEISSIFAANRFHFACNNDTIVFTIIWKHGVHLTDNFSESFFEIFKKFSKE